MKIAPLRRAFFRFCTLCVKSRMLCKRIGLREGGWRGKRWAAKFKCVSSPRASPPRPPPPSVLFSEILFRTRVGNLSGRHTWTWRHIRIVIMISHRYNGHGDNGNSANVGHPTEMCTTSSCQERVNRSDC